MIIQHSCLIEDVACAQLIDKYFLKIDLREMLSVLCLKVMYACTEWEKGKLLMRKYCY